MIKPNMNYANLKDSYLFFRIAQEMVITDSDKAVKLNEEIIKRQKRILELYRLKGTNRISPEAYEEEFKTLSGEITEIQERQAEIEKQDLRNRLTASKLQAINEMIDKGGYRHNRFGNYEKPTELYKGDRQARNRVPVQGRIKHKSSYIISEPPLETNKVSAVVFYFKRVYFLHILTQNIVIFIVFYTFSPTQP